MTHQEFISAQNHYPSLFKKAKGRLGPDNVTLKMLSSLIEAKITIEGHAWCMDVKRERKKMSRLIAKTVLELL